LEEFYAGSKGLSYDFNGFQENSTTTQTINLMNLRGGSPYFLSVGLNQTNTNSTEIITVTFSFNNALCPGKGCVWDPPSGQCVSTNAIPRSSITLQTDSTAQFFYYDSLMGNQNMMVTSTANFEDSLEDSESIYQNFEATNGSATFPIYVKRGALPTFASYDRILNVPVNALNNQQFSVPGPIPGTYYFLFYNTFQTPLSVTTNVTSTFCSGSLFGPNCNQTFEANLTNTLNATQINGTGDYQYFVINKIELLVGVGLYYANSTAPTIAASFVNLPNNNSYILISENQNVNFIWSNINPSLPPPSLGYWLISVWANVNQTYYIWANSNCPNNCSVNSTNDGTGTCSLSTGVCTCDSGFSGLWCFPPEAKHKLKAIWIVLIVIACVIILAIAIGVPVACYLKNRKRARYERV